jgi:putative toxin-antitoxin system antitoxin component (TIGR02293 family)
MSKTKSARKRGWSIGLAAADNYAIHDQVLQGFLYHALTKFVEVTGFSQQEVAASVDLPATTLARRKTSGRFSPEESERLARLALLFEAATELFEGNAEAAQAWMRSPHRVFGGKTPIELSRTEFGARLVEDVIGRLEYGVFT